MTPLGLMEARRAPLRLVIFDCDGVIVDSEGIASRICARSVTALGWPMTADEAQAMFLGMTLTDMIPVIEARTGAPIPPSWTLRLMTDMTDALASEATAIEGAVEAMRATSALGLPWRIASNSSHEEMRAKFACLGITDLVAGRVHSHRDVARGKPAPDLFLATAAAGGVRPEDCVVIEDSMPGARAAAAAGMDCLGFAPHSDGEELRALGAVPFRAMRELPDLFAAGMRVAA